MYYNPGGYIQVFCNLRTTSGTNPYASTDAVTVSGKRTMDLGHSYEESVRNHYGDVPFTQSKYEVMVNAELVDGIADNVVSVNGRDIAIGAKFVDDWEKSLRNPDSLGGAKL